MNNKTPTTKHNTFLQVLEAVSKYLGVDTTTPIATLRKRPLESMPYPDIEKRPRIDNSAKQMDL